MDLSGYTHFIKMYYDDNALRKFRLLREKNVSEETFAFIVSASSNYAAINGRSLVNEYDVNQALILWIKAFHPDKLNT